ncbi:matrix-remodeling-associated protein 5-like [Heterodontus francisci]|uniref:matrix-remodeling-associated protein 5-like n=1 Tax=Heterodontus francisci TaxID=7792 RepID=UPI00355BD409
MQRPWFTVFAVCLLISAAELQPFRILQDKDEINVTVGDAVILSVKPSSPVVSGFWKVGSASIVIWTVEASYLNIAYTKRNVELLYNTSLMLHSVTLTDTGDYWVTMDSATGKEATAKITLNVFAKPIPFNIAVKHSEINTTAGDTVLLSVTPSEEVKNGSWKFDGKDVVCWKDAFPEVDSEYKTRAAIFAKTSLQLKSVSVSDTGDYSVTMSTSTGTTRSANIHLNVIMEPQPLNVSAVLSKINAEAGASVLLSVTISGEVKNGSWALRNWVLFRWNTTMKNTTENDYLNMYLLPNASLLLKDVDFYTPMIFIVTLESPSGGRTSANITLKVFTSRATCQTYNTILTMSILLTLIFICAFAMHIHKKQQAARYETYDILAVFCKGYRVCLSFGMMLAFNSIIIFAILVNKHTCVPGQQPALDFYAK